MALNKKQNNNLSFILTKLLLTIIIILGSFIYVNWNEKNKSYFKKYVLEETIDYQKFNAFYDKMIGKERLVDYDYKTDFKFEVVKVENKDKLVFLENFTYKSISKDGNGYKVVLENGASVPVLNSGIIVFIGTKDNLRDTIIVQGNDGVDIWYSNVIVTDNALYDYVSRGHILGISNSDKVKLTFVKDNEYISYENYFK